MPIKNLWPAEITNDTEVESPVVVLKEQATLLGQTTKNLVEAYVQADNESNRYDEFKDVFYVESSTIDYRYRLFYITYSARLYPVDVHWLGYDGEILEDEQGKDIEIPGKKRVFSREELERELARIFSDADTIRIVQALVARARLYSESERGSAQRTGA